ncbi:MAG: biopolymer transporter ExbD [Gemmataceae bacterium]|nr:biopolymer transporter ExbD [Gemmataceae bacterium]
MTWSVRHEGSPRSVAGQTTEAIRAGLADGRLDPTDEVRGESGDWVSLEAHPVFAAAAAEVEPPLRPEHEDESRLDMNPLIDVTLVLLIFFILTTTYESIRKVLDMPGATTAKLDSGAKQAVAERVKEFTIRVTLRPDGIRIEDQTVGKDELSTRLAQFVKTAQKRQILLDAQGVDWGAVVAVMDAARAAGIEKTLLVKKE